MSFDLEDLGWTRPPPGNLVAFLAAGLALRRMHQRAQRGDDDEPLIRDDDAPAVAPASSPRAENAPEDAARNRTRESLAARLGATDARRGSEARLTSLVLATTRGDRSPAGSPGSVSSVSSVTSRSPVRDAETEARACRFCLLGEDDVDGVCAALARDTLVAPCACSGTQKWVHVGCLRRWQHISVAHGGARRSICAVCRKRYRVPNTGVPRERAKETLTRWFSPSAADRVASYKRAWWQIATNTVLAQEGVPRIGTPAQLAAVLAATELRIWGQREARGGNRVARLLQTVARKVTNAHSAALVAWLAVLGARSLGDALGGPGGLLDGIADRLALELRRDVGYVPRIGAVSPPFRRPAKRRAKRFFLWACRRAKASGGIFGVLIRRVVQPSAGTALRVAEPAQNVVTFVERFPQYRVA